MMQNAKANAATTVTTSNLSREPEVPSDLLMPTLGELLDTPIPERQHILRPWLREHESCLLYGATGVGKSLFALTAALAVTGNGSFLGWRPDAKADGTDWRVLYVDGEMHIGDIQERARILMDAVPDISRTKAKSNLQFLARQQQDPTIDFPEITDVTKPGGGQERILQKVLDGKFDLLILDNFSTLGRVADENAASSFDDIQSFLLKLKSEKVATILVHHTGKGGGTDNYRGSTKLAATFEIMLHLKRYAGDYTAHSRFYRDALNAGQAQFELEWHKLRSQRAVGKVLAKLTATERQGQQAACWKYSTSLDLLNLLKANLQAGLYKTKTEIATAAGLKHRGARDIIARGGKHRVWTDANIRAWLALGAKRRKAGETTAITKALPVSTERFDDDEFC
jgi:AAA domain